MNKEKARYAILKKLDGKDFNLRMFDELGISEDDWTEQMGFLQREKYIDGVVHGSNKIVMLQYTKLTEKGEHFMHDHKAWTKIWIGAKEVREWINALT